MVFIFFFPAFDPVLKEKPKKIVVKGSWDNWAGETQLHLHDDANKIFKAFIALNQQKLFEYKFVVDGEWMNDFQLP